VIYPNPVRSVLNIDFSLEQRSDTRIILSTLEGKLVFDETVYDQHSGINHISLDISERHISYGIYIVIIQTEEFKDIRKFVIVP
jgi:hypothetical protein